MNIADRAKELTRPTGEEDLLDVRYPKPRLRIAPAHAAWLGGIVLLLTLGFVGFTQSRAAPTAPGPNPYAVLTPTPTASAELVVSVVGAVEQPRLLTLAPSARVADALQQTRPLADADLRQLNLAQKLSDGTQLVVPRRGEPATVGVPGAVGGGANAAGGAGSAGDLVNINTADAKALENLPGVGPKTAEAIVAHRAAIGGFSNVEQLKEIKGIGPAKFEKMREKATL